MPTRRFPLALALMLPGCGAGQVEPSCMTVQQLDAGICRVLPTGLVLHYDDGDLKASILRDDGTLELVTLLPGGIGCDSAIAHDPEGGKLWWVEVPFDETTPSLHQFDLASATEDWQRDLVYPGYSLFGWSANLLAHEGALYLGAYLELQDLDGRSLLERYDVTGEPVWTHIGYPGFAFGPEGRPLEGIRNLIGTSTAISFFGYITGTDSSAITGASVDPQTGELLWSTGVDSDDYSSVNLMSGDGESLYVLSGSESWIQNDPETQEVVEVRYAQSDIRAITPRGEERWRIDESVWPKFVTADFTQAVVADELVHLVAGSNGYGTAHRTRVTRRRTSDGGLVCESDLPEVAALVPEFADVDNDVSIEAWPVGDRLALEVYVYDYAEDVDQRAFLLLKPVE